MLESKYCCRFFSFGKQGLIELLKVAGLQNPLLLILYFRMKELKKIIICCIFRGGFITQEYGSRDGGYIDAIQLEVPSEIRYL